MSLNKTKFIFVDRDGVINKDRKDFVKTWDEFEFIPGAIDSIKRLNENGFEIIIITNQSGIARGFYTEEDVSKIHKNMLEQIKKKGGKIKDIFYCSHHPKGKVDKYRRICDCRKPNPGLLLKAARKYNIDLTKTWMIGDSDRDIEAGKKAGCKNSILVLTGHGKEVLNELFGSEKNIMPDFIVPDLLTATEFILNELKRENG